MVIAARSRPHTMICGHAALSSNQPPANASSLAAGGAAAMVVAGVDADGGASVGPTAAGTVSATPVDDVGADVASVGAGAAIVVASSPVSSPGSTCEPTAGSRRRGGEQRARSGRVELRRG